MRIEGLGTRVATTVGRSHEQNQRVLDHGRKSVQ